VDEGGAVTVAPDDTLDTAYKRMRVADVSQLPVMDGERLIGLIDESDILEAAEQGGQSKAFARHVSTAMTAKLNTLQASERLEALIPVFERDEVAIVLDGKAFLGLITRIDLINHLRRVG
jgi:cystathionine beta-synthase